MKKLFNEFDKLPKYQKPLDTVKVYSKKEIGGKIHKILNETLYRKLTIKEYKSLIELIDILFK